MIKNAYIETHRVDKDKKLVLKAFSDGQKFIRLQISAKDVEKCPPVDIFCCVDVSRSMRNSCAGKTDGRTEYVENGFSLLDLI